jgi:hypothetical protein
VAAGCKIIGVVAPVRSKAYWKVTYDPSCKPAQIAAGNAAAAAFDLNDWKRISDQGPTVMKAGAMTGAMAYGRISLM